MDVFDGESRISLGALETLQVLYSDYDPEFALFCYLWERWQVDSIIVPSICVEDRMGLRVSELLGIICIMITKKYNASGYVHFPDLCFNDLGGIEQVHLSHGKLLKHMRQISLVCVELLLGEEIDLCRLFLDTYHWIWTPGEDWRDHPFLKVPTEVRRAYATSLIERHLTKPASATVFAREPTFTMGIQDEISRDPRSSIFGVPFTITDVIAKASDPTLAKSIGSSSRTWSSVKKTAQRARDLTRLSACSPGVGFSVEDEDMQTLSDELDMFNINDKGETEHHHPDAGLVWVTTNLHFHSHSPGPVQSQDENHLLG
jgi:hypothetical protein